MLPSNRGRRCRSCHRYEAHSQRGPGAIAPCGCCGASGRGPLRHRRQRPGGEGEHRQPGRTAERARFPANTHYFTTIQAAVNASTAGDYVLIEPGVYDEEVKVTSAQSGIWIRGMNRNTVIIDGQHKVGQRDRNPQGERRLGRKPHRAQLRPRARAAARRRVRQRDLVERRRRVGQNRSARLVRRYLTAYDTGLTAATASSRTTRSKARGKTSTPPASTTRACTSAPARNARRVSPKRRWKTTRSATRARTRAAAWRSKTRSSGATRPASRRTPKTPATGRRRRTANATGANIEHSNPTPMITTTEHRTLHDHPQRRDRRKQQPRRSRPTVHRRRTVGQRGRCCRATTPIWSKRT